MSVSYLMSLRKLWKIWVGQIRRTRCSQTRFERVSWSVWMRGAREEFEWRTQSEVEEQD